MSLEQRTLERIAREFPASEQESVIGWLNTYSGPEAGRIAWDILELSKGQVKMVGHYVKQANMDYRDVLYWAEYYDNDPLVKGRDPKKLVEGIVKKWVTQKTAKKRKKGGINR
jgi:hypothetical protein